MYWQQISRQLFADGLDGWWLDASEPELSGNWGEFRDLQNRRRPRATVFNAYPLLHTAAVYEGQRAENAGKRVFILTRSAYAGQQRNAAVTWTGDIAGTWEVFKNQIPAGLNFSPQRHPLLEHRHRRLLRRQPGTDPHIASCSRAGFSSAPSAPCSASTAPANPRKCGGLTKPRATSSSTTTSFVIACCPISIPFPGRVTTRWLHHDARRWSSDFRHDPKASTSPTSICSAPR